MYRVDISFKAHANIVYTLFEVQDYDLVLAILAVMVYSDFVSAITINFVEAK